MKVVLGTFACNGIEACLGTDVPAGVRAALNHLTDQIDAGAAPAGLPDLAREAPADESALALDLSLDERTFDILKREAVRQGATLSQMATHSVLAYLAELDRLTAPDGAAAS